MPGIHEKFLEFFRKRSEPANLRILDIGAGHGAFSKKLYDLGYDVQACDLFPELFEFDKIECKKVDVTHAFPYPDNAFDLVIAIEVSEHIADHESFFSEISRILKPDGKLYMTTPNILSLKSRMRFLFSGFFYSFKRLKSGNEDGLQHVASLTLDQYNYLAVKNGFKPAEVEIDLKQNSSRGWLFFLSPAMFIYRRIRKRDNLHNQKKLLLGRLLFLTYAKDKRDG
ncbi:MAG: class I SAM-dependent methyltransferase [Candidatus Aminicenantales bacterium]